MLGQNLMVERRDVSGAGGGDRRVAARLHGNRGPIAVDDNTSTLASISS